MPRMMRSVVGAVAVAVLSLCTALVAADFTTNFTGITQGAAENVTWDAIDEHYYPLYITLTSINQKDNGKVDASKANITTLINGTIFTWRSIPYPLRYNSSSQYQLELRPTRWNETSQPVLARSTFFEIDEAPSQTPQVDTGIGPAKLSLPLTIVLCVGIPVVVAASITIMVFMGRRKARLAERRRQKMVAIYIH